MAGLAADANPLRAGAARVDITPPADAALQLAGYAGRTKGFEAIHDHIYARAIVVDDGANLAAIVACEVIGMPDNLWEHASQRIAEQFGIPVERQLLAGEHTHGAPSLANMYGQVPAANAAYTAKLEDAIVESVRQAKANLQPARIGIGNGLTYVNINRREFMPGKGWWWLGYNADGPSDKTVSVIRFETPGGAPIAFFINYAVHGTVMGQANLQLTGDLPGATSRYVERHFQDKAVALWTSGAAGDQNPVSRATGSDFTLVEALGQILGEQAVRASERVRMLDHAPARAAQRVITCPGQKVAPGRVPRKEYQFEDAGPVNIRLSLLMLGDIALAGVSGEVLTFIGTRLKNESPFRNTLMVTHADGSSGYIPNDAAYDQISYEITTTHLKRGCAEAGIVNGFLEMMEQR